MTKSSITTKPNLKKSLEIIALQQPVSSDLRTVITALKASSDVERMGDHAVAIAKATIRIKGEERLTEIEAEIKKMGRQSATWSKML